MISEKSRFLNHPSKVY